MSTSIQLVGGPTAVIEWAGLRLISDPTFSPPGDYETAPGRYLHKLEPPAIDRSEAMPLDLALLSHDQHADNLDPAGRELLASVPLTLTTPLAASRLQGGARGLQTWEDFQVRAADGTEITVTGLPARHGPPGCEPLTGPVAGFLIRSAGAPTIYMSGDNASLDAVRDIAERFQPEIALLFAGAARTSLLDRAPLTLTSVDAVVAAEMLKARWIVPLHFRGWSHFSEGPDALERAFSEAGTSANLVLLAPGEKRQLD